MKKYVLAVFGVLSAFLSSGLALAQGVKTQILTKQLLEKAREVKPHLLEGISLKDSQVLVIDRNQMGEILNLSIFEDSNMAENHVDGTGSAL